MKQSNKNRKSAIPTKLLAVITLSVLIFTLYAASPFILKSAVSHQLSLLGYTSEFEVSRPSFNHIEVSNVQIQDADTKKATLISIQKIKLNYNLRNLLALNNFETIQISNIDVKYQPQNTAQKTTSNIFHLEKFLPQNFLGSIPAEAVYINNLSIHPKINLQTPITVFGNLSYQNGQLSASLKYKETNHFSATVDAKVNTDNEFTFSTELTSHKNNQSSSNKPAKTFFNFNLSGTLASSANQQISAKVKQKLSFSHFNFNSPVIDSMLLAHFPLSEENQIKSILKQVERSKGEISFDHDLLLPQTLDLLAVDKSVFSIDSNFKALLGSSTPHKLLNTIVPESKDMQLSEAKLSLAGNISSNENKISLSIEEGSNLSLTDVSIYGISNRSINLKLKSLLNATTALSKVNKGSYINNTKIENVEIEIYSDTWQTPAGQIKHLPLKVYLTDVNLGTHRANLRYHADEIFFTPLSMEFKARLQALKTTFKGKLRLERNQLAAVVDQDNTIDLIGLTIADELKSSVQFITTQPIVSTYDLVTKKLLVNDFSLLLLKNTWDSQSLTIKNSPVSLFFSDLDNTEKTAKMSTSTINTDIFLKDITIGPISTQTQIETKINKKNITISLAESSRLSIQNIQEALRTDAFNINSLLPVVINIPIEIQSLNTLNIDKVLLHTKVSPIKISATSAPLYFEQNGFSFNSLLATFKTTSLRPLRFEASSKLKKIKALNYPNLPYFNLYSTHKFNKSDYQGYHKLTNIKLPFTLTANINSYDLFNTSLANWSLKKIDLAEHNQSFMSYFENILAAKLPEDFSITKGSYQSSGTLKSNMKNKKFHTEIVSDHQLNNLSLTAANILFEDLNYEGEFKFNDKNNQKNLVHLGKFNIKKIHKTLPIENIFADLRMNNLLSERRDLKIKNAKATLLEAQFSLQELTIPIDTLKGKSILYFDHLPLKNVLALEQQPTLTGSGILKGELPFRFHDKDLWVDEGKITATKNGYISYLANDAVKATAADNTGLKIALDVLENFHYDTLDINLNYKPDGVMLLKNNLAGKNPQWQNGQPINFSINIEENILQLLKAIQFSDTLTDKIEKKLNAPKN